MWLVLDRMKVLFTLESQHTRTDTLKLFINLYI